MTGACVCGGAEEQHRIGAERWCVCGCVRYRPAEPVQPRETAMTRAETALELAKRVRGDITSGKYVALRRLQDDALVLCAAIEDAVAKETP